MIINISSLTVSALRAIKLYPVRCINNIDIVKKVWISIFEGLPGIIDNSRGFVVSGLSHVWSCGGKIKHPWQQLSLYFMNNIPL